MLRRFSVLLACVMAFCAVGAQKKFELSSPDGKLAATVSVGDELTYGVAFKGRTVIEPSAIALVKDDGEIWGKKPKLSKTSRESVDEMVASPFYRSDKMRDHYNAITLQFKGGWGVEFRAYDDGVAYRFTSKSKKPFNIENEIAAFRFPDDYVATVPYVKPGNDGDFDSQFYNSFENTYADVKLSKLNRQRLSFLPLVVDAGDGVKVCITESDLCDYPGMYLVGDGNKGLEGVFAPYPKRFEQGGHNNLQMLVKEHEQYIAKVDKPRSFPWRVAIVTESDKELAASNLSYILASPSRVDDLSWIKPGKVAWDWWNDWNLDGVDFVTGVNNDTYKAYIDFAASKGIEYVILDEGWAVNLKADLMQVVDDIDLEELVNYAAKKNVGIILWAGYYAFARDMENVCRHYSEMGVKGFKVDFMDRDDQEMVAFTQKAAEVCAKYKMILDLHGMYKPAGMNRTYPNVLNFEGVHGLETMKWDPASVDQVKYDVQIPFLRQVAGPLDYTQGAMRNASKGNYFPCYNEPMSQGTRCRQLALYMVFDSPFNMLCDTPSNYMREEECTDFIANVPTVWDETRVLDGKMGEYIVTARRSGDTWYIGGITDWSARDIELDLSFLGGDGYSATLFKDGKNAHRIGRDYKCEEFSLDKSQKLKIHLAPGGGFALKLQILK